jgi:hypothetical protein
VYDSSLSTGEFDEHVMLQRSEILDGKSLVPLDETPLLDPPSQSMTLDIMMTESEDGSQQ